MKQCPSCGYEDTKTQRQMLALYRKYFGDVPVQAMLHRGWIRGPVEPVTDSTTAAAMATIRAELIQFFNVQSNAELDGLIAGTFEPWTRTWTEPPPTPEPRP